MAILSTIKMYIDNQILGGRKLVEAATETDKKDRLISLQLFKKWDLVHDTFPYQTVSDYISKKNNKSFKAYSSLYNFQSNLYKESREVKKPSNHVVS